MSDMTGTSRNDMAGGAGSLEVGPPGARPAVASLPGLAPEIQVAGAQALEPPASGVPAAGRASVDFVGEYGEGSDAYDHTQMGRFARIVALHAGIGTPSTSAMLAERLGEATRAALEARSRIASVQVVALRPLAGDIALAAVGGPVSADLQEAIDALAAADAVIAVSPVFQASYSGLFKSFFDILPEGTLRAAPVLMGATAGTARHSLVTESALRPLFAYLKAIPTTLAVFAASEDFGASWESSGAADQGVAPLGERIERAGEELAGLVERFPRQAPVDAMGDFTPMEALLRRGR
ncbi:MAG: NAD(P)H-dependent oxidoreductase [Actinomyces sp.]|uniref:CE1759 family FMN reductase n=1 Tax=Actinomyces sp. TaxID=29317 RepID=UPI0026DAAE47|nr:CE1759 family FMN reductase [Actinomyces sp.]MDO4242334.1 NAD(P)H-dependent oxidoreductase [Actinomyces sp.]